MEEKSQNPDGDDDDEGVFLQAGGAAPPWLLPGPCLPVAATVSVFRPFTVSVSLSGAD